MGQNLKLIHSGIFTPIFNSTSSELQNLMRHYSNNNNEKLHYLIKASIYCKFAAHNNSLNNYVSVEDFLTNYNGAIRRDNQLEKKVRDVFSSLSYDMFTKTVIHLLKFYQKMVKQDSSLTLNSMLSKFREMTRDAVQDFVKSYSHPKKNKSNTSTTILPIDSNNIICNNNNEVVSPLVSTSNRSKASEYDSELFSPNNTTINMDSFPLDMNLFEEDLPLSPERSKCSRPDESSGGKEKVLDSETSKSFENNDNNSGSTAATRRSPRKRTEKSYADKPKKKRLPPKTKPIPSSVERINITEDEKASVVLQKEIAHLSNMHSMETMYAALELQNKINPLCIKLKKAIENNYKEDMKNNKSSSRDGFKVSYSNNMGYHSQNSGLKGFTFNFNNKYFHDFNEKKRDKKTQWEQQIWDIGIEIMRLKGLIKDKGEELCMEFGFMKKGDYVEQV